MEKFDQSYIATQAYNYSIKLNFRKCSMKFTSFYFIEKFCENHCNSFFLQILKNIFCYFLKLTINVTVSNIRGEGTMLNRLPASLTL